MSEVLRVLQGISLVLATWTVVAALTALILGPWLRAQARANARLSQDLRSASWRVAGTRVGAERIELG